MKFAISMMCLCMLIVTGCQRSTVERAQETEALKARLGDVEGAKSAAKPEGDERLRNMTRDFYERRQFKPVWIEGEKPLSTVQALVQVLGSAPDEGLNPKEYGVNEIPAKTQELERTKDLDAATDLELYFSRNLLRYALHVAEGHPIAQKIDSDWSPQQRDLDIPGIVLKALEEQKLQELPVRLAPPHAEYVQLKRMLQRYRKIAAEGGYKPIPLDLRLNAGDASPQLAVLRNNLLILGDLPETPHANENVFHEDLSNADAELKDRHAVQPEKESTASVASKITVLDVFDDKLSEAVRRFETRHALEPDGVPGPAMIAAMNVPIEDRIRQIELNLERWRWMPADFGSPYLFANIPSYSLQVHGANDEIPVKMKVIVGTPQNRTPIFSATMTHVVFSPYWNIPDSIEAKETLPLIMKDPTYLERKDLEVVRTVNGKVEVVDPSTIDWENAKYNFDFQIRQKPGDLNALGLVKFIFPNRHNVYFHDTPTDNLFDKLTRSFSHGCVRLEKPTELATFVLRDQPEWTAERIDAAMHAGEEKYVTLKNPIPVHIVYLTARADKDGELQFFPDIYGYDLKQNQLLNSE